MCIKKLEMKKIFKRIYNYIPLKKQLFSLIKKVWLPGESMYKHLHFKGVFTIKIDSEKQFRVNHFGLQLENEIFWEGLDNSWEKESIKVWMKLCLESNVIMDIGANTGIYGLVAKTINPISDVIAFEPHPYFYKMLQENIKLNAFDIKAVNKAVSNIDGIQTIDDYLGETTTLQFNSITLDTFIKQYNIAKIDLIKIDVEKHEPKVLEGFNHFLSVYKPTILIEVLNNEIAREINDKVINLGYLFFNIDEKNGIVRTKKIEKSNGFNYLLCNETVASNLGLL
jgi:FkbM family methyltransferase